MGLLQAIRDRFAPTAAERTVPDDVFDAATLRYTAAIGTLDRGRPTETQIRDNNRGLFGRLVQLRADAIGQVLAEATVVRMMPDGTYEEVEVDHPWVRLLRRPNPHRASIDVWRWVSFMRDLSGPSDFVVERGALGVPIALHEVFPVFGQMHAVPDGRGGIAYWRFDRADGVTKVLEYGDVIRVRHPDPVSPYETQSLMERAAYELDKVYYGDTYERDMLKEGRTPPMALTTDQQLNRQQIETLRDTFRQSYQTAGNVKGVPVLSGGVKPTPISAKAGDLALTDQRKLTDTHLFWLSGAPQGLLSDAANRANADAARYIFAQQTVSPETLSIAGQLTIAFERIFGAEPGVLEIRVPDAVPVDEYEQSQIDERRLRSGTRKINELRERDNLDPVDGGDEIRIPFGLEPIRGADSSFSNAGRPAERTIARKGGRTGEILRGDDDDPWQAVDRERRRYESPMESAALTLFHGQADTVIAALYDQIGEPPPRRSVLGVTRGAVLPPGLTVELLFDLSYWLQAYAEAFGPLTQRAMAGGWDFAALAFELEGSIPEDAPTVRRILDALADRTSSIPRTTMGELEEIIEAAIRDGDDLETLARAIRSHYDDIAPYRARTIAQTTATAAFEGGQIEAFRAAGIKSKRWLSQRDGRVREAHRRLDGVEVGIDEAWVSEDPDDRRNPVAQLRFPGDPEAAAPGHTIGCRCSMLPGKR